MPKAKKHTESSQSQRFVNFAREVGADQDDEETLSQALRKMKRQPQGRVVQYETERRDDGTWVIVGAVES